METTTSNIAETILSQLGGRRFIAMTGSKNFLSDGNKLRMNLARNKAGVNKLFITLDASDTYTMHFFNYSFTKKTFTGSTTKEQKFEGVYDDMLQEIFTKVTGLYTKF